MSLSNVNKEMRPIIQELRAQGWKLEDTNNGHARARPPDPRHDIVVFSRCEEPRAIRNVISQLKKSGFIWPPPPRERTTTNPNELIERLDLDPSPVSQPPTSQQPVSQQPVVLVNLEDQLYAALRDARENFRLSKLVHEEAAARARAACEEADRAQAEVVRCSKELEAKKLAFDEAFAIE